MTKCRGDAIEMGRSDMAYLILPNSKLCGRDDDGREEEDRRERKMTREMRERYTCPML
jgi:hypothetical protein